MSQPRELKLDREELQLLADFERGEFESIRNFRQEKRRLEAAASATLRKNKRINIRISDRDLEQLQKIALREGIPYQTLISSTLHKFVAGRLKEVD
jgi:predicted DNA binding CopG/RHH family protein